MSRRPALRLFLLFQALYALTLSGWVLRVPDEYEVAFQVESLWERGSLAVPQVASLGAPGDPRSAFFGKQAGDGGLYAPYGPGVAFLCLPHHAVARAAGLVPGWSGFTVRAGITALAAATAGAAAVAGFFAAARLLGASVRRAAGLAVLLGAGTVLWPYARSFFSEAFAAATLVGAAVALLRARAGGGRAPLLVLAAALLAATVLVKATNAVYALALALAPLAERALDRRARGRAVLALVLGVAGAGLVHAQWNTARFGTPFDFGYDWGETIRGAPRPFALEALPRGLAVLLLSPGKSLLVWAPALAVLALPRARALAREDPAVALGLGLALGSGLLFFGSYAFVEGGYCHGPRHLVPIVPLLLLPAARGPAPSRRALLASALLGVPLNLLAASTSYLEDQAWGLDRSRAVYYETDRAPGPGRPENRYRLGYLPQLSLPAVAARSASKILRGEPEEPGTGLDFLALHLRREGGPSSFALVHAGAWLLLLLASGAALGNALLRTESAAILRPGGP